MKYVILSTCFLLVFSACDKPEENSSEAYFLSRGILIANEGNFQWGNASLSFYDLENEQVQNRVFEEVNQRPLGDVLQSITLHENTAFLVLNNSGRIEVINKNTFELLETISGFTSPRYLHVVSQTKAYVSDLYANKIAVLDLENYEISSFIECAGWLEELFQIDNRVYALNKSSNSIWLVNTETDEAEEAYTVDFNVSSLSKDVFNRLWLCGEANGVGKVQCLDAFTFAPIYSYDFVEEYPTNLVVSASGSDVYFLSNGVWHINEFTDQITSIPMIPSNNRLFYGLSVHQDRIYIADAINYVQQGTVWVYSKESSLIKELKVGIIPSEFDFISE